MPRDVNGNYVLPAGNPVVSGATIESTWANNTMSDLANEMTDSLSRSGKGGLTGPLAVVDKSGTVPGLNFTNEPTSGLKRESAGDVRLQVQGNDVARFRGTPDLEVQRNIGSGLQFYPVAINLPGMRVMSGEPGTTTIPMYNINVPPLDWSLFVPDANVRNLVIGGTGGTIAGTDDAINFTQEINFNISGTTSAVSDHTHLVQGTTGPESSSAKFQTLGNGVSAARSSHTHDLNFNSGWGGGHDHTFNGSGSDTVQFQPRHAVMILAKLNA